MSRPLRLCLVVESTQRLSPLWQTLVRALVEPLLSHHAALGLELSLVLFGAHPPHSLATVQSSSWLSDVEAFRRLLEGVQFVGGGRQPVALAEALQAAAALFALPPAGAAAPQQHCLACVASEPSTRPVPWPCADDLTLARLPGAATSVELCRALRRRGVHLGVAGGNLMASTPLLWHLANLVSEAPLSLADARLEQLKQGHKGALQQLVQAAVTLPVGAMAVLPFWPQGLELLMRAGGKQLPSAAALAAAGKSLGVPDGTAAGVGDLGLGGGSLEPLPPAADDPAAQRARAGGAAPAPAPGSAQWTPPGGAQPTPPLAGGSTPGSFLEVLNAEILMSPEDASPALPDARLLAGVPAAPPQPLQPSVQGLPLPPVAQGAAQQQQQQQQLGGPGGLAGGRAGYAVLHTGSVIVGSKITRGAPLALGVGTASVAWGAARHRHSARRAAARLALAPRPRAARAPTRAALRLRPPQVTALPEHAALLAGMAWPRDLQVTKNVPAASASQVVASKPGCVHTRLRIAYDSPEAEAFPQRLLSMGGAGIMPLQGSLGVLMPLARPGPGGVVLRLVVLPNTSLPPH